MLNAFETREEFRSCGGGYSGYHLALIAENRKSQEA
jgi:hypothetical protein